MPRAGTKRDPEGLTDLERRFAAEYLVDLKAAEAYQRASLPRKVAYKTASTNAWKMMQREPVQELIRQARDRAVQKAELSVDKTLDVLRQVLSYDVRRLLHNDGTPKGLHELDDDTAAAIVGVDVVTFGNADAGIGKISKYKLADKVAALEKAMKYHGLFEKDNKQQAEVLKEIVVNFRKADGSKA